MIRTAAPADTDAILALAVSSGLFIRDEVGDVSDMLAAHFDGALGPDHVWLVDEGDAGDVGAVAYYAPEPFGPGVWNLYMLAVDPDRQGSGLGSALVRHVETALAAREARVLLIETSSLDRFGATRTFYAALGYVEEARIRAYYGPSEDKVVFWKSIGDR